MRKFVLLLAFAVAFSLAGFAQAAGTATTHGSETQGTTKTHKAKKGAAAGEKSAKESQLTGCLAKDASGSGYMLTNGRYKKGVEVKSSEDLSAHVGHEVKLMGTWEKPSSGEAGGAGAKGETMRTFNASGVNHISDTCKAAGGSAKSGKSKKGAAATSPTGF